MKALFFLVCALALGTVFGQAATTETASGKKVVPLGDTAKPKPTTYLIVMNEQDILGLFSFIQNANLYSAEGRQVELDDLRKHVMILPTLPDSANKPKTPQEKPKK